MNGLKTIGLLFFLSLCLGAFAQDEIKHEQDSTYIFEVEAKDPPKVLHAEPLYIDLIRDLGARKGEREWNFGLGLTDNLSFDTYEALVEYEWAPINRLGLEIEVPFTLYAPSSEIPRDSIPSNRMEGIKTAIQWSFFVNAVQLQC